MATGRLPDPNSSPLTAKGDLYTYSTVPAKLAVGSNGETLVADSSATTGLRWQENRTNNFLYNSNFDIWQRGTSFASVSGYSADRWSNSGILNAMTTSRETSGSPAGSRYYFRNTSSGASSYSSLYQYLETNDVEQLWGKTVTFSFKIRRNSTMNSTISFYVDKSSTVDAGGGATWTAIATGSAQNASIPTGTTSSDWLTVSCTGTIPNDGTANSIRVNLAYNTAVPSGSILDLSQMKLEIGNVATPYQRQNVTLAGELAACQRYYSRSVADSSNSYAPFAQGISTTATTANIYFTFPVPMRVNPTSIGQANLCISDLTNYNLALTNLVINQTTTRMAALDATSGTGATALRPAFLRSNNSATGYLEVSAEL